jgi:DNA-binding phage protein
VKTKKRSLEGMNPLIADLIRAARASDMSFAEIEKRAGVYNQFLSVVGGRAAKLPRLTTILSVAEVLGLELTWRKK